MLKLALALCAVVSSLFTFQTPAFAIAIYNDFVQASFSASGPIPPGTSISFDFGTTSPSQSFSGNAFATSAASFSQTPIGATVLVTGFASGPGSSFASSIAFAHARATLVNLNVSTVTFPLTVSHSRNVNSTTIPFDGQSEFVSSTAGFVLFLDSNPLVDNRTFCSVSNCNNFDSGSDAFLFGLTPGSHSLGLSVFADGTAFSSPPLNPTPEPATLLLFGTTAAGLGLARWRQRRRGQSDT